MVRRSEFGVPSSVSRLGKGGSVGRGSPEPIPRGLLLHTPAHTKFYRLEIGLYADPMRNAKLGTRNSELNTTYLFPC